MDPFWVQERIEALKNREAELKSFRDRLFATGVALPWMVKEGIDKQISDIQNERAGWEFALEQFTDRLGSQEELKFEQLVRQS